MNINMAGAHNSFTKIFFYKKAIKNRYATRSKKKAILSNRNIHFYSETKKCIKIKWKRIKPIITNAIESNDITIVLSHFSRNRSQSRIIYKK